MSLCRLLLPFIQYMDTPASAALLMTAADAETDQNSRCMYLSRDRTLGVLGVLLLGEFTAKNLETKREWNCSRPTASFIPEIAFRTLRKVYIRFGRFKIASSGILAFSHSHHETSSASIRCLSASIGFVFFLLSLPSICARLSFDDSFSATHVSSAPANMAPLVLHNVPDDELYVGADGVTRPFAVVGAADEYVN